MQKFLILILIICGTDYVLNGQDRIELFDYDNRSNYLLSGGYAGIQKTLDEGVSPLLYEGISYGADVGYRSESHQRIWQFMGTIGMSSQFSAANNDLGYFTSYNIDVKSSYLWNMDPGQKIPLNIYGGFNVIQAMRFRGNEQMFNASFGYDIITGTGISGHLSKKITIPGFTLNLWRWKYVYKPHKISIETEMYLPLLYMYLRPTYVVIENFVDGRTEPYDIDRFQNSSFGNIKYLEFNTGISYQLLNRNSIRLGYIWQYYSIKPDHNPVQGAHHLCQLIFKFKLNQSNYE